MTGFGVQPPQADGRSLDVPHSPKQSLAVFRRWAASDAGRRSAVRSAGLALPTQKSHMEPEIRRENPTRRASRRAPMNNWRRLRLDAHSQYGCRRNLEYAVILIAFYCGLDRRDERRRFVGRLRSDDGGHSHRAIG